MNAMRIKYRLTFQKVGDIWVGAATGADAKSFSGMVRLNTTGYEVYSLLRDGLSEKEAVARLKEKYTSGPIEEGVRKVIATLSEQGILEL